MSGHSKWAGIKHKKALIDAKKGKVFSKITKEITVAAREKGANPENNPRLRLALDKAREANMPQDNVKRAIQRGTGELPGQAFEDCVFEGYGPGGVAVIITALTDNKNRASSELRKIFSQNGGNLGEVGCVGWMFKHKGLIQVDKKKMDEETLMNLALEAGAEDFKSDDEDVYEIITQPQDLEGIKEKLKDKVQWETAEVTMVPNTYIKLAGKEAEQMLNLMEGLEDHEDVQNVYANFDIPKEVMEKLQGEI